MASTVCAHGAPLDTAIELPTADDTEALGERLADGLGAGDLVVLDRAARRGQDRAGARPRPGASACGAGHLADVRHRARAPARAGRRGCRWCTSTPTGSAAPDELDDLDLDTDLADAVVAVEWGEGVAEQLAERHLLVRLDRRPDDVRTAVVTRG